MGPDNVVKEEITNIGNPIDIDDIGPLNEFVEFKVEIDQIVTEKLMLPIMSQSFQEEFDASRTKHVTPTKTGTVF